MSAGPTAFPRFAAGVAILGAAVLIGVAFRGYDAVGLVLMLQSLPFCG